MPEDQVRYNINLAEVLDNQGAIHAKVAECYAAPAKIISTKATVSYRSIGLVVAALITLAGYLTFRHLYGPDGEALARVGWVGACVAGAGLNAYFCSISTRDDPIRKLFEFWFSLSNFGVVAGGLAIGASTIEPPPPGDTHHAAVMFFSGLGVWVALLIAFSLYHLATRGKLNRSTAKEARTLLPVVITAAKRRTAPSDHPTPETPDIS